MPFRNIAKNTSDHLAHETMSNGSIKLEKINRKTQHFKFSWYLAQANLSELQTEINDRLTLTWHLSSQPIKILDKEPYLTFTWHSLERTNAKMFYPYFPQLDLSNQITNITTYLYLTSIQKCNRGKSRFTPLWGHFTISSLFFKTNQFSHLWLGNDQIPPICYFFS